MNAKANHIRKRALDFAKKREWDNALKEFIRLAEIEEHNPNIYNELGDIHLKMGNKLEAFSAFHNAIDAYTRVSLFNNAVAVCKKIVRLNSGDYAVIGKLSRLRSQQGFTKEAANYAATFLDKIADDPALNPDDIKSQVVELSAHMTHSPEVMERIADYLAKWEFNEECGAVLDSLASAYDQMGQSAQANEIRAKMEALGCAPTAVPAGADGVPADAGSVPDGAPAGFDNHRVDAPADGAAAAAPPPAAADPGAVYDVGSVDLGGAPPEEPAPQTAPPVVETPVEAPQQATPPVADTPAAPLPPAPAAPVAPAQPPVAEPPSEATQAPAAPVAETPAEQQPVSTPAVEAPAPQQPQAPAAPPLPNEPVPAAQAPVEQATATVEPPLPDLTTTAEIPATPAVPTAPAEPPTGPSEEMKVPGGELPASVTPSDSDNGKDTVSVSDIVGGFTAEVKADIEGEDYRSHYDLGMAYLEMDLLPEAIREFQAASTSSTYLVRCLEMIGLCFLKQNQPRLAIKQLEKGLGLVSDDDRESLGLCYNLGLAYEMTGDFEKARTSFEDVYVVDVTFRDVNEKFKKYNS